jgi:hypothetical protein
VRQPPILKDSISTILQVFSNHNAHASSLPLRLARYPTSSGKTASSALLEVSISTALSSSSVATVMLRPLHCHSDQRDIQPNQPRSLQSSCNSTSSKSVSSSSALVSSLLILVASISTILQFFPSSSSSFPLRSVWHGRPNHKLNSLHPLILNKHILQFSPNLVVAH